jgi:hypothetical protein
MPWRVRPDGDIIVDMSDIRRITDSRGREWRVVVWEAPGVAAATRTDDAIGDIVVRMERSDERHFDLKLRGRSFSQMTDAELAAALESELVRRQKAAGGG